MAQILLYGSSIDYNNPILHNKASILANFSEKKFFLGFKIEISIKIVIFQFNEILFKKTSND